MTSDPNDYPPLTLKPARERKGKGQIRQKCQAFSQLLSYVEHLHQNRPKKENDWPKTHQCKQNQIERVKVGFCHRQD
ncbi:hypothetical protein [Microcoleus sp. FACHB-672]|uniref:hypothetical protein n=1 Tax=Microcoleus sp. FACHB-672 TaxID=2692825 RepID=UPI0016831443|nr:hypothetical protein [Microcoleus sp. FACHB-672]MBD2041096.1 hypothetical protein [Microcoleus sp. FACHB-672]